MDNKFYQYKRSIVVRHHYMEYPNTDLFLVRIFQYSDWIRRDKEYLSVFSPNTGKYVPKITLYLGTFHARHRFRTNSSRQSTQRSKYHHSMRAKQVINELAEASRYWYLMVREELNKLTGILSKLDRGIFSFYKGPEMTGRTVLLADDLIWVGTLTFYQVISKFRKIFHIESENQDISLILE